MYKIISFNDLIFRSIKPNADKEVDTFNLSMAIRTLVRTERRDHVAPLLAQFPDTKKIDRSLVDLIKFLCDKGLLDEANTIVNQLSLTTVHKSNCFDVFFITPIKAQIFEVASTQLTHFQIERLVEKCIEKTEFEFLDKILMTIKFGRRLDTCLCILLQNSHNPLTPELLRKITYAPSIDKLIAASKNSSMTTESKAEIEQDLTKRREDILTKKRLDYLESFKNKVTSGEKISFSEARIALQENPDQVDALLFLLVQHGQIELAKSLMIQKYLGNSFPKKPLNALELILYLFNRTMFVTSQKSISTLSDEQIKLYLQHLRNYLDPKNQVVNEAVTASFQSS